MSVPPRTIEPLTRPPDTEVRVPGSKSLTNRALIAAALATGTSRLTGVLAADDTAAMLAGLQTLGVPITVADGGETVTVTGVGGCPPADRPAVDVRLSGTTARFLAPLLALVPGPSRLDGDPPFRRRPMGPTLDALEQLGCTVAALGESGHLPVTVTGSSRPAPRVQVAGDASSQFLSGLLLVAPVLPDGLTIELTTPLVSEPYVAMTIAVMAAFGATVVRVDERTFEVEGSDYRARDYEVEPDASAATYPLAAAAITGGRVKVLGLDPGGLQGDARFAEVLGSMGASVHVDAAGTQVTGTGHLQGIEVDLGTMSDTAQTLAATAVFADRPTRITGIGFIRAKETDRIAAMATELRRLGISAIEEADGLLIHPGTPRGATVRTYDDHRMAMSLALIGLVVPGVAIEDPDCVAKTFPGYYRLLEQLRG